MFLQTAINNNKLLVTANKSLNKSLIDEYMDDLETFLAQKQYHYGLFGYKATVCGGISIVHILKSSYTGNTIHSLNRIVLVRIIVLVLFVL